MDYWKPTKVEQRKAIELVFDVLNTDVDSIDGDDLVASWLKLTLALQGLKPVDRQQLRGTFLPPRGKIPARAFTPVSYGFLGGNEGHQALGQIQKGLKQVVDGLLTAPESPNAPLRDLYHTFILSGVELSFYLQPDGRGLLKLHPFNEKGDYVTVYQFLFLRLLEGFRLDRLHRCSECGSFYIGRRNKQYCSRRCAWKVSRRSFRERHKEEYRKYMCELMRHKRRNEARWNPQKWRGSVKKGGKDDGSQSQRKS